MQEAAVAHAEAPAVTWKDIELTYVQLWHEVAAFGAAMRSLGSRRGDRIAIYLNKRTEAVTTLFGASAAGGVFVPVNPLLKPTQVGYIICNCDARIPVNSPERLNLLCEELNDCKSVEHVVVVGYGFVSTADVGGQYRVIKTSGYRIRLTEIEEPTYETGLVRDAVAVGIEDPKTGAECGADSRSHRRRHSRCGYVGDSDERRFPCTCRETGGVKPEILGSPNGKFDRSFARGGDGMTSRSIRHRRCRPIESLTIPGPSKSRPAYPVTLNVITPISA